jgi:hypothetical protein
MPNSSSEIQRSLGRIEGKLDSLTNSLTAHTLEDHSNFNGIDKQISGIQNKIWMAMGAAAIIGFSIPPAIAYFIK